MAAGGALPPDGEGWQAEPRAATEPPPRGILRPAGPRPSCPERTDVSPARLSQLFSNVGHSYSHVLMLLYPTVVLALEPEMGMGYGELLVLMTPGNVLFGFGALPAGWLGDRWSTLGMMVVFFVGMGASAVVTGLASSPAGLAVGLALVGLFASIYHPVGMAWLVRSAPAPGRALGQNGVFGSLGLASAALVAGTLTGLVHWRAAFLVPGAVSILTGLALLAAWRAGRVTDRHGAPAPRPPPRRDAMVRAFVVLSVTMLCTGLVYNSIAAALPKVLVERVPGLTGGSPAGAGLLVSAVYLLAMGMQVVGGHLADRYPMRDAYVLAFVLQAPVLLVAAWLSGPALYAAVAGAVLLGTVSIPVENALLSHYSPERWRGTAFGAKFVLALGVSAIGVPIVAFLRDSTGDFRWFFVLLSALAALVALAALLLPRDRPDRLPGPAVTVDR